MRVTRCIFVCAALAACGDDSPERGGGLDGGLDGGVYSDAGPDAGHEGGLDASMESCARRALCKNGLRTEVEGLCTRDFYGAADGKPSAGLYFVCVVDPSGTLYFTSAWRGDVVVTSPNWTHSAWSTGLVPSTLSAADEARCNAAKESRADGGVGICGLL